MAKMTFFFFLQKYTSFIYIFIKDIRILRWDSEPLPHLQPVYECLTLSTIILSDADVFC